MKQKRLWRLFMAAESSLCGLRWSGEKLCVGSEVVFLDGQNLPKIMTVHRIFVLSGFFCSGAFFLSSLFHPPYSTTSVMEHIPSTMFTVSRFLSESFIPPHNTTTTRLSLF